MVYRVLGALLAAASFTGSLWAQTPLSDEWQRAPVDDRTFQGFLQFFAYDRSLPFNARVETKDTLDGVDRERLTFQSTPDQRITALIYRATGSSGDSRRWILLLHGGAAPGKDAPSFRYAGALFARAGWNVLAIDMLHFGERKTDLLASTSDRVERLYSNAPVYLQWMAQNVKDAGRSFDFLVTERGADPERIALVGVSRGAVVAMIVGGADPRFKAVAPLYGGHYLAWETIAHLPATCPANYLGRISPRPVLMINGTTDNLFLRESSVLPLQRLAKEPKTVLWFETIHMGNFQQDLPQVANWLREHVK
jgi:dienelactone hydrolase